MYSAPSMSVAAAMALRIAHGQGESRARWDEQARWPWKRIIIDPDAAVRGPHVLAEHAAPRNEVGMVTWRA